MKDNIIYQIVYVLHTYLFTIINRKTLTTCTHLFFGIFLLSPLSFAQVIDTSRANISSSGIEANTWSSFPKISGNGQFVVFQSSANNLTSADSNGMDDIFIHDRVTGQTELISVDSGGVSPPDMSNNANVSADGRYVVFTSMASTLVPGDTNGWNDVFVRDRQSGTTERISISTSNNQTTSWSDDGDISDDGRYVVFTSNDNQLVPNDTNGSIDIFLRDRQNGTTTRISVSSTGTQSDSQSTEPKISGDGAFVIYTSLASNLVNNDTNGEQDIFIYNIATATTERVNLTHTGAESTGGMAFEPNISDDGRFVVFRSMSSTLVSNDTNFHEDIFLRDIELGTTERISISTSGNEANGMSSYPSVSIDGRYVAFLSMADNLINGDTNGFDDVFIRDRVDGTTTRINLTTSGNQTMQVTSMPHLSSNALYVTYQSDSPDLVLNDNNGASDIFVAQLDHIEAGAERIRLLPSSLIIDPIIDGSFTVDVEVSAKGLYGLELNCQADSNLAALEGSFYGPLFDPNSRLEIPANINSPNAGDWQGSISLMSPAEAVTGSGVFATLHFNALIGESANLDITCTANAADIFGAPLTLEMENATITIDDGIHTPGGATLSGTISFPPGTTPNDILVTIILNGRSISTYTDTNGNYSFDSLKDGNWVVSYSSPEFVSSCSIVQTQNGQNVQVESATMVAGDINGDNSIDIGDFTIISSLYGKTIADPEYLAAADLNSDGIINIFDLTILGSHFGVNNCDPSTIVPVVAPAITFSDVPTPPIGTMTLNTELDEVTWERDTNLTFHTANAFAHAAPADINQYAIGLEMSGAQSSYFLEIRNTVLNNHIYVHYDYTGGTANIHLDANISGTNYHDDFIAPMSMGLLELGVNAGTPTVVLDGTTYASSFSGIHLGGNPNDWQIEIRIEQSQPVPGIGSTTAKLISDASNGLSLPSSEWSMHISP